MEHESYTGSWERNGRSITAAAIISLIGIGVFYFYLQSMVTALVMIVANTIGISGKGEENHFFSDEFVAVLRLVVFATQYLFMLLPSWLLVRRLHSPQVGAYIRLSNFSFSQTLLAVIGTVSLIPLSLFFSTFFVELLGIPQNYSDESAAFFTSYTPAEFAWLVFGVSMTPALCEEIFFRGHVQRTLERTVSIHSIWIIGILFGLFHFQPLGLASLSLLGLFFGYLFYRSKSLYPSIAAHFTNNTIALLFAYQPFVDSQQWVKSIGAEDLALINVGTLPIAAGAITLYHRSTVSKQSPAAAQASYQYPDAAVTMVESDGHPWIVNGVLAEHVPVINAVSNESTVKIPALSWTTKRSPSFRR